MKNYIIAVLLLTVNVKILSQINSQKLDQFFDKKIDKANIIGLQAAIISNGNLVWSKSYGLKNFQTKKKVNDSTLFLIASCSKPVTALAILKLFEQQNLKLDDDINKHLPFKIINPNHPTKIITIRMLLSHTSSLKDDWDVLDPLYTVKEGGDSPIQLMDFIQSYFLPEGKYYNKNNNFFKEEPGNHWEYCNMGYALLGLIIEQISGEPFETFMKKELFEPLNMSNSFWFLKDIPHDNIARPHELATKKDSNKTPKLLPNYGYPDFPDGQLRTTVADYAKLISLILQNGKYRGKQFLKEETIEDFLEIQFPEINKWQAIAWNYNEFESKLYYLFMPHLPSHTGGDPGVATVVSFNPKTKAGAIIFVNSPPNTFKGGKIFYLDMMKKLLKTAKTHNQSFKL